MSARLKIFIFVFILMGICGAGAYGMYTVSNMLMTHTLQVNKTSSDIMAMEDFRKKQVEFVNQVESSISVQSAGSRVVFDELTKIFDDFLASEAKTSSKINDYNATMHVAEVYGMIEGSKDELMKAVLSNRNYYRLKALADPSMSIYENAIKSTDEHISTLRTMESNEYVTMKNALTNVTKSIFIGGGIAFGTLLLMLIVLQVSLAGKLRKVAYTLEDMLDEGNLGDGVHVSAGGELGSIVYSINQIISGTQEQLNTSLKSMKDMNDSKDIYEGQVLPLLGDINTSFREIRQSSSATQNDLVKVQHSMAGIYEMTEYNDEYLVALSEITESSKQELNNVMKSFRTIGEKTSVLVNTADTFIHLIQIMDTTLEMLEDIAERFSILRLNISIEAEQLGAKDEGMLSIISSVEAIDEDIVNSIKGMHEVFEEFQQRSSGINSLIQDAQLGSDDGGAAVHAIQTLMISFAGTYSRMHKTFSDVLKLVKQQEGYYSMVSTRAAEVIKLSEAGAKDNTGVAMVLFNEGVADDISDGITYENIIDEDLSNTQLLSNNTDDRSVLHTNVFNIDVDNGMVSENSNEPNSRIDIFGKTGTLDTEDSANGAVMSELNDDVADPYTTSEAVSLGLNDDDTYNANIFSEDGMAESDIEIGSVSDVLYKATPTQNQQNDLLRQDELLRQDTDSVTLPTYADDVDFLQGESDPQLRVSTDSKHEENDLDLLSANILGSDLNRNIANDLTEDIVNNPYSGLNPDHSTTLGNIENDVVVDEIEYDEPLNVDAAGIIEKPTGELDDDLESENLGNPFKIDADK